MCLPRRHSPKPALTSRATKLATLTKKNASIERWTHSAKRFWRGPNRAKATCPASSWPAGMRLIIVTNIPAQAGEGHGESMMSMPSGTGAAK